MRITRLGGRNSSLSSVCSLLLSRNIHRSPNFYPVSQDPDNYRDAPTEGIRRVLETVTGKAIPRGEKLDITKIGALSAFRAHYS